LKKRVELIRGEIVQMTPINIAHANCATRITEWSFQSADLNRVMICGQNPIRIPANNSEPEPDVVWVNRQQYSRHPEPADILLLIEVADSSLEFDRTEKLAIYAEAGIAEYWIVNLSDEQIDGLSSPERPQLSRTRDLWQRRRNPSARAPRRDTAVLTAIRLAS
jgi:Uma2 family endonuclease